MSEFLGKKAKDPISGFEGTVTAHAQYITGIDRVLLEPPAKDGAYIDGQWFDLQRVTLLDPAI